MVAERDAEIEELRRWIMELEATAAELNATIGKQENDRQLA
jgi:hypothetical protein